MAALIFRAGSLHCALPLDDIVETMRPLPVQPLAGVPRHVSGVTVVRGAPVPVVDVAVLLGGHTGDDPSRFVVVRAKPDQAGPEHAVLATGAIVGVEDVVASVEAPRSTAAEPVAAIAGYGGEPLLVLRCAAVVPEIAWTVLDAAPSRP